MATAPLFIRLYLDEDFHPSIAVAVRQRGFDCEAAGEVGMIGKSDLEQLQYAATNGRCLLTFNVKDFALLAQSWAMAGRSHAGIVVTPQVGRKRFGWLLGQVLQLLNSTTADEMLSVFRYL